MTKCDAKQFSDQMLCMRCDQAWDVNDPCPPACKAVCHKPKATHVETIIEASNITDLYVDAERHRPGVVKLARQTVGELNPHLNAMQALGIAKWLYDEKQVEVLADGHSVLVVNPYYKVGRP